MEGDQAPRGSHRLRPRNTRSQAGPSTPHRSSRNVTHNNGGPSGVARSTQQDEESIEEDDLCPICRLLLYSPVKTSCNHTLCASCMAHWADVSLSQQMTIVDVDEEPVPFNPVSGLEARCPMCRTQTIATPDAARTEALKAKYPSLWAEREVEEEGEGEMGGIQTLTVYVGNRHKMVESEDANQHEWAFFVKPSRTDIVEEVQFLLHPTFRPNRVIRQRAPYEIRRLGWGVFTLVAYVILKAGYSWVSDDAQDSPDGAPKGMLPLEWTLDFNGFGGKGSMGRCRLKVKNDHREWEDDVSDEEERDNAEWGRVMRAYERDVTG
ncbi:hypothetical protein M409DRAFT_50748 [Zasmidium cellare ATCC 36951]|uniref:Uncharacterized protein n=1 Tax=Zasmidium cellare ATCC 36951 TaxID=1080233 RepID=A0A6A6CVX0_ZASCE|nr:uncharacterized protein M409DRAFT_50748 [Zasmidium cellare ATCC 36951]KAF2171284.1 hypothetical protein M409DRAFT_50748 [Zasmidium cellare ATCC 36951]